MKVSLHYLITGRRGVMPIFVYQISPNSGRSKIVYYFQVFKNIFPFLHVIILHNLFTHLVIYGHISFFCQGRVDSFRGVPVKIDVSGAIGVVAAVMVTEGGPPIPTIHVECQFKH